MFNSWRLQTHIGDAVAHSSPALLVGHNQTLYPQPLTAGCSKHTIRSSLPRAIFGAVSRGSSQSVFHMYEYFPCHLIFSCRKACRNHASGRDMQGLSRGVRRAWRVRMRARAKALLRGSAAPSASPGSAAPWPRRCFWRFDLIRSAASAAASARPRSFAAAEGNPLPGS